MLGHEPLWEPLDPTRWLDGAPRAVWELAVAGRAGGRAGGFIWLAVGCDDAEAGARMVVRRLLAHGRVGGALALAPVQRRLAVAVAWEGVPTLALALDAPDRAALAALRRVRGAGDATSGGLALVAAVADALALERLGHRFFRAFRAQLDRMAAGIDGPLDAEARHAYALLQLTRVLFLYFVQAKGWLDGRPDFLARQVDRCLACRRSLDRDLFRPLFFGTLNRPREERRRTAAEFGRIPFLNGGLFEPHPLERRGARIPDALWRDAFDELFERYHFTVSERADAEDREGNGIAPDMLGRVFEGVMQPEARRSTGTFYTPAALVREVLAAAFAALVARRLGCGDGEAGRRLDAGDPAALRCLADVTILDPACGSGAFLLGALELLAALRARHDPTSPHLLRRAVLQRNLFGVDLNAAAVRLCELRLWLAVVADDPAAEPSQVAPLPNLDRLVRQGDSLADAFPASPGAALDAETAAVLGELRRRIVAACGAEKAALARCLRRTERDMALHQLDGAAGTLRARLAECLEAARAPTLFGGRRGLDAALRAEIRTTRARLRELRATTRRVRESDELPWFHYRTHFADVLARGGFDLVVGNPPWVRAEELAPALRSRLAERYRWWRSGGRRASGFAHRPDLAVAFLERAWELAAPNGGIALLVPAKLATAAYGASARHALAAEGTLHAVADLTASAGGAFDATVYPLALVATRGAAPDSHRVRTTLPPSTGESGPLQQRLRGGGPWVLATDALDEALALLRDAHPPLAERYRCRLGVKTGANAVFLDPPEDIEPELLRPAARGRDLAPFRVRPHRRLLWTHDTRGEPLAELPPRAAAYLARHRRALAARSDARSGGADDPPWTLFRARASCAPYRVVWADLSRTLTAAPLVSRAQRRIVPLNSCYVAAAGSAGEALALAAWLNSTWLRAIARATATPAAGGFARFTAGTVGALPLPPAALADDRLAALATAMGETREVGEDAATRNAADLARQEELDALVAHHLGLSDRARRALRSLGAAGHRR